VRSPETSYEITNLELCFIDLIAAGLQPAPAENARWSAAEAIAYMVKGVAFPWEKWQGAGASPGEIEQAEIDLGELIGAGVVRARGRPSPRARKEQIPADDFNVEMIETMVPAQVIVRIDGTVGTWPPYKIADYKGPPWSAIEVDSASLRKARPRPLTAQAAVQSAEQIEGRSEPAARTEEAQELRGLEKEVVDRMKADRPRKDEHGKEERGYATRLWNSYFKKKGVSRKTVQNIVSTHRETPAPGAPPKKTSREN
jgi:hypothetical protein